MVGCNCKKHSWKEAGVGRWTNLENSPSSGRKLSSPFFLCSNIAHETPAPQFLITHSSLLAIYILSSSSRFLYTHQSVGVQPGAGVSNAQRDRPPPPCSAPLPLTADSASFLIKLLKGTLLISQSSLIPRPRPL